MSASTADRDQTVELVRGLGSVRIAEYAIVGSYTRYDEGVRQRLKDARLRIAAGCSHPGRRRDNHLVWAAPGSGKTYFVEQVAASMPGVEYRELNLAKLGEQEFREGLEQVAGAEGPRLCLVDEVDAKPDASWPYELLLPFLDTNLDGEGGIVFVLAGSSGSTIGEFKERIVGRPKGKDVLSRVPQSNEWEIAPMDAGDRILVVLSQMLNAAADAGRAVGAVEKLALHYVASAPHLANARQLREFAVRAVERGNPEDDRVRYDDLFDSGDPENKRFWTSVMPVAEALVNSFVLVEPQHQEEAAAILAHDQALELPRVRRSRYELPAAADPLLGRERELDEAVALFRRPEARLLTLTGPGGIGKTRLGLELARRLAEEMTDGAALVALDAISDPELVASTIRQTLELPGAGEAAEDVLVRALRDADLLLVLDNFEQVLPAAPLVARLLAAAPGLKLLVTSRAPLRLAGEHELPVPPLAQGEAVELFVARARAVAPDLDLSEATAAAVGDLCTKLEGLPLAIELAAARSKLLPPAAMLARLGSRLDLPTGTRRDASARHRTLRATIDWSHELLDEPQQRLFARLGVFAGGCSLEACEAVCDAGEPSVLEGLAGLVDESLLRQVAQDEPRFTMLETIREYAVERLGSSGEEPALRRRHAEYFLALVEAAEPEPRQPRQADWYARVERDHDNLRAAQAFLLEQGDAEEALRLCVALGRFWWVRAHLAEGRRAIETALAASPDADPQLRSRALNILGILAGEQGDFDAARSYLEPALDLARELGDHKRLLVTLLNLGNLASFRGEVDEARRLYGESLEHSAASGDVVGEAIALENLGWVALGSEELDDAVFHFEQSAALARQAADDIELASALRSLAGALLEKGERDEVASLLEESLALSRGLGEPHAIAHCLDSFAGLTASADAPRAARLFGAADAVRASIGALRPPDQQLLYERWLARTLTRLDLETYTSCYEEGRTLALEQACALAVERLPGRTASLITKPAPAE